MNYYNENDKGKAAWLRELMSRGVVAPGVIDERSIVDVRGSDLAGYEQCHFFAGICIWSYALRLAGWPDDRPIWTASCPCQPFSAAGKRKGTSDERHLWPELARLVAECAPSVLIGEQVSSRDGLVWFDTVSDDLERASYTVGASDLCAASVGAPHIRQRLYWAAVRMADASGAGPLPGSLGRVCSDQEAGRPRNGQPERPSGPSNPWSGPHWLLTRRQRMGDPHSLRPVEPGSFPLAHGAPARVLRLRGYGDAIVAPLAAAWIESVMEEIDA